LVSNRRAIVSDLERVSVSFAERLDAHCLRQVSAKRRSLRRRSCDHRRDLPRDNLRHFQTSLRRACFECRSPQRIDG